MRIHRLHLTRNLRSLAFLLVTAAVLALMAMLAWANFTGMPAAWRAAIEHELGSRGAHIKIGKLSYHPLQGVLASDVRIFADPERQREISRLAKVILDFDKTKLARREIRINRIELKDADLELPLDPESASSTALLVRGVNGTLLMPGRRRFEIRNAHGRIAGIDLTLDARIIGYQQQSTTQSNNHGMGQQRELLSRIIAELHQWKFPAQSPPSIHLTIDGNANDWSTLNAKVKLQARDLEKNRHVLNYLAATAEVRGNLVTVTSITATDSRGSLSGHFDYHVGDREGRFDLRSSLEIPALLRAWLNAPPLKGIVIKGRQALEAAGNFHLNPQSGPHLEVIGHARCDQIQMNQVGFESAQCAFAWRDGELFLRDAQIQHRHGQAHGKALVQWPQVRLAIETDLPLGVCRPMLEGKPVSRILNDFTERAGSTTWVSLEGGFDASDRQSWAFSGAAKVTNMNYRGVPVNSAECKLALSQHELDFFDGTAVFNYENYGLRQAFNGPKQGTAKVGRIRYDAPNGLVEVEAVSGAIWAAPVLRLFAPKIAESVEVYRFHHPPELKAAGVVDVTPQGRTDLAISFSSQTPAEYRFLGEMITLDQPSGKVLVRNGQVFVEDLSVIGFDGPIRGRFETQAHQQLLGELSWNRLSLPALTSTYGFTVKGGGRTTGRINFTLANQQVQSMSGDGLLALEQTELLSVPIFGPLSPLISGVLNDRRAGFERAKSAFCTFRIKDGILRTDDFHTATTSLTFSGNGSIDLTERTLDLIIRMNARGLLGLITLPLRPFYGMFQFHGTGPLKSPQWENVMFTPPPEDQRALLLPAPKAQPVSERR